MAAVQVPRMVLIGGSAGSFQALREMLGSLTADLPAAFALATHLPPSSEHRSLLPQLLAPRCALPVQWAADGAPARAGVLQIAPQDCHLVLGDDGRWRTEPALTRPRPSVDRLFRSVVDAGCGASAIAVVLSGYLTDGARGAQAILDAGGALLVQAGSQQNSMPRAALHQAGAALVLPSSLLGPAIAGLLAAPGSDAWFRVWPGAPYVSQATDEFGLAKPPAGTERPARNR